MAIALLTLIGGVLFVLGFICGAQFVAHKRAFTLPKALQALDRVAQTETQAQARITSPTQRALNAMQDLPNF